MAQGWGPSAITRVSDDGSRAIVCASGRCELVTGACFPAGTPVHTPTGLVPIEKISIGDTVIAYNESTKIPTFAPVTNTFHKTWRGLLRILTGRDTLLATPNHPFYIPALGRYLPADSLRRGVQLLALTGALLTVQGVAAVDTTVSVYNFEVADHHNYYVGAEGVLVHNDCVFVKAGLKSADGVPPADDFDIINQAFLSDLGEVQTALARFEIRELLTGPNGEVLTAFFRGDGLVEGLTAAQRRAVQERRVRAWEIVSGGNFNSDVPALLKIDEHLSYFQNDALIQRQQGLKTAFASAANKQDFINPHCVSSGCNSL